MCTYSGNHPRILRCDICDSVRGTRWDYYLGQSAEASSGSQQAAPARDSPTAREGAKQQGGSAGARGQRSILGFFSEADRKSAAASASQPPPQDSSAPPVGGRGMGAQVDQVNSRGAEGRSGAAGDRIAGEGSSVQWEQRGDGSWTCSQCGSSLAHESRTEHEDYHLAILLQKAESGRSKLCLTYCSP